MVIDPSAILAIIYAEAEEETFLHLIAQSKSCLLSAPGYVETSIVLGTRHGEKGVENLDLLLKELSITVVPFSPEQAKLAAEAFLKFGKGRHKRQIEYGRLLFLWVSQSNGATFAFQR